METRRLDALLVEKGLAPTLEKAQALVLAGQVIVDEHLAPKPGHKVDAQATIRLRGASPFVSRGGSKLQGALEALRLDVDGLVAADIGASTGGFTDCLLQHGVTKVYAIDVGYGELAWSLRQDDRVVVMERTNVRHIAQLPEQVDLVTIDASFISLTRVLPAVLRFLKPSGRILALIKPQFEAKKHAVEQGGVVRDEAVHRQVLDKVVSHAQDLGLWLGGLVLSPLRGPAGNVEFFALFSRERGSGDVAAEIALCLSNLSADYPS